MTIELGVLTFHRCINYGSYWQARCLVEGLRERGHEALLLDHRSERMNRAEWRCALEPVPGDPPDRRAYASKTRRFLEAFDRLPLSSPFDLDAPRAGPAVERVVVGSDEVWNLRHPWYGGEPLFYGGGLDADCVAYAASFGNQPAGEPLPPAWSDRLRGFSAIAVRDSNSARLVGEAIDSEPTIVLDPCLQFADRIDSAPPALSPYLLLYGHSFPDWFATALRAHADSRDLPIVSLGYRNAFADQQWIDAGPDDFADAMAGATAIATNFFHGCVFSLVNRKPFIAVASDYRSIKISDLFALLGTTERLLHPQTGGGLLDHLLGTPASAATYAEIERLRLVSSDYLDHALA